MRILPLLAAFSLSACAATVPVGSPGPDPDPTVIGEGNMPANEIVVYRAASVGFVPNVGTAPAILLDGRSVGTCRVGQPLVFRVPNGTWTITAMTASGQVSQGVRVEDGERKNLRCGTSPVPSLSPVPTLVPVGTEVAQEEAGL